MTLFHASSRRAAAARLLGIAIAAAAPLAASAQPNAAPPAGGGAPVVTIRTSLGPISVELAPDKAPTTVANFLQYVKDGHYDGTIFHRVIPNFMIQGGGFTRDMRQKPTRAAIPLESRNGLKNERGTVAMARTSVPDSATSQFFINVVDNRSLDHPNPDGNGYAVFGRVVRGMEVVEKIRQVPTGNAGMHQNVPTDPVVIESVTLEKAK